LQAAAPKETIKPMLCQFAHQFPLFVADFLERGRQFKRRVREVTVTDLMMVNLQAFGSGDIIVDFPDEPTTGADMEWNFVNRRSRTFYRFLLQAKCAYGNDANISRLTFKYLSHRTNGRFQADILCDTAQYAPDPTYPLYIFYNPECTCAAARDTPGVSIEGVNLADGYSVRSFATSGSRKIPQIRHHLHSLTTLFCTPDNRIPTPTDVLAWLMRVCSAYSGFPKDVRDALVEDGFAVKPPEVGTSIPADILVRIGAEVATPTPPLPLRR
jgi:hypothetical protein